MPETRFAYQPLPHDTVELNDSLRRLALAHDALANLVEEIIAPVSDPSNAARISLRDPVTDDLKFPATGINLPGQPSDPDVETDTGLLLFDDTVQEVIAVVAQMPHAWAEGSSIQPHVHWERVASDTGTVLWRLEYKVSKIGEVRDANWTTLESSQVVASITDDGTPDRHLITSLGDINIPGGQISDMLVMRLSRMGNLDTATGDARLLEFDLHILKDALGSTEPFTKA